MYKNQIALKTMQVFCAAMIGGLFAIHAVAATDPQPKPLIFADAPTAAQPMPPPVKALKPSLRMAKPTKVPLTLSIDPIITGPVPATCPAMLKCK